MRVRRTMSATTVAAILLFAAALTACSSSGHASPPPTCADELRANAPVTDKGARPAGGPGIPIAAGNAAFDPTCVTDVPRGTFSLTVVNSGKVIHNVTIAAQHIDVDIKPNQTVIIPVKIDRDAVVYVCKYHRTLGMVGVLIPESG